MPTSIPRNFMPAMFRPRGIIQAGRTDLTRLRSAKIQTISLRWPAFRQPRVDNQRKDKRVESYLVRCLDGGSSPPISTKTALSCAEGRFCGDTRLQGKRFPFSTPVSCADSPFQGHAACALGSGRWLRCIDFIAEVSLPLATAADAAFGLRPQIVPPFCTPFFREISDSNLSEFVWS